MLPVPKPNVVPLVEGFHPLLVEGSGYKVCTIVADPSGMLASDSIHFISNSMTSFSEPFLDRLRSFLHAEFQVPNLPSVSTNEDNVPEEPEPNPGLVDALEEQFIQELEDVENEIDATAEEDPAVQALQQGEWQL